MKSSKDIDDLIKMSTSDSYDNSDSDIDKLIRMSTDETNIQEDEGALKKAFKNLAEDVLADTYGDKKTAERVKNSPRKTEAQREKDAQEHSQFIADLAIAAARVPGGIIDDTLNLATSTITLPMHIWTGDDYSISSGADLGEKALHALTDNKMAEFGGKNRSKTSDWMQTILQLLSIGGAPGVIYRTGKALSGASKAVGVGSAARLATEQVAENTDQNTKLGRLATVLTSLGVPIALSKNMAKKAMKKIDSPPEYTKGVDLDAYFKNEELGIPRAVSADADLNTPAGRALARKTQHFLEKSPELEAKAGEGLDYYREIFKNKDKTAKDPETYGKKLYNIFDESHQKLKDETNAAIAKVWENLESVKDKKTPKNSSQSYEKTITEILKSPDLSKQFLDLNAADRIKFINDRAGTGYDGKKFNFLEKSVTLSNETDPRFINSDAILPSNTVKALHDIYENKKLPSAVNELFQVIEKNKGLTSLEHLYEWKKDFIQSIKKQSSEKDIDPAKGKFILGKVNEAFKEDMQSRLGDLDKLNKTERVQEFDKYNKKYRDYYEEISPETIRALHQNAESSTELFKLFTNALTEKETSRSKNKLTKSLNNFFNKIPNDLKKDFISEMIFEMGFMQDNKQWSPNKFKQKFNNMSKTQQAAMNRLFSLSHPNSKHSLFDWVDGIQRSAHSLEYRNTSQTAAHMNASMENMMHEINVQKAVKDAFKKGDPLSLGAHAASAAANKLHRLLRKKYIDKNFQSGDTYNKAIQKRIDFEKNTKAGKYDFNKKDFLHDLLIGITANK